MLCIWTFQNALRRRVWITDHTSTTVKLNTHYDQRPIDMDISGPTARVMVSRGMDQRLTNRFSSRPRSSCERDIASML